MAWSGGAAVEDASGEGTTNPASRYELWVVACTTIPAWLGRRGTNQVIYETLGWFWVGDNDAGLFEPVRLVLATQAISVYPRGANRARWILTNGVIADINVYNWA